MKDIQLVLNNFPFPEYRPYQKDALEKITNHFNSGGKLVLLEAPTGFGKSPVNIAIARTLTPAFYVTPQKILQDQIKKDFSDVVVIKGRSNYVCVENPYYLREGVKVSINCNNGPCRRRRKYKCQSVDRCIYLIKKAKAMRAPVCLMNFSYFISVTSLLPSFARFPKRELLVIDEGHNIDNYILDVVSLTLSKRTLPFNILMSIQKALKDSSIIGIINEVIERCEVYLETLEHSYELSNRDLRDKDKLGSIIQKCHIFLQDSINNEWVVDKFKIKHKGKQPMYGIKVQPLYLKRFGRYYLWDKANKYIVSSATIFFERFINEAGVPFNEDEILKLSYPSDFPVENRKIIDASIGKLTYNLREENINKTIDNINFIIGNEKEKGLIHTHSYKNLLYIKEHFNNNPRFLFHESGNREEKLNEWFNSKDKVLVGVAMTEGLDLKDDLCRWQICFKCPYPDINDSRVKIRLEKHHDYKWYNISTLITLIQMYGRAVRHKDDYATFYFLDSSVVNICNRNTLPVWFKQAWDNSKPLIKKEIISGLRFPVNPKE